MVAATALCAAAVFTSPAFAEAGANLTFTVNVPTDSLLEVKLFNADGTEMGNNTSMNVVPSMSAAGFNEKEVVVSVGTNNEWGYNLMMNIDNTSLVSSSDSSKTIPSLAAGTTYTCTKETADICNFTLNSWGFQIKDDTASQSATNGYIAIPNSIELNKNTTTTNGDPTHILFGSKINAQQAPGAYSTTINFVATANPDPTPIMQNISNDTLAELIPNTGNTVVVKDSRDNIKYTIGRLADGKVWMLDNLALDLTNSDVKANLTSSTTNASDTTLGYLKNGGGTTSDKYATAGVANWTSSYSYSAPLINMSNKNVVPSDALSTAGGWKVGGYYNYCAASAGSYCYGNGTSYGTSSGDATEDICPKGWRLPTGNTGEFNALYTAYSSNYANFRNAFHLPFSGHFNNGSAANQGSGGYFWSSARDDIDTMYFLGADTIGIYPVSYGGNRRYGYSVRCIADPPVYMQDVDTTVLAEKMPNTGDTTTLYDKRDGSDYTITNIGGTFWMTQNLRFTWDSNTTLSPSTTNVSTDTHIDVGDLASGNSYTEARIKDSGNTNYGTYYNYCAVSAGTVCNNTEAKNAISDICPKGWRLPTQSEITTIKNNKGSNWNAVAAGFYGDGPVQFVGEFGYWWSATADGAAGQYRLIYDNNFNDWRVASGNNGYSVRCVAKEKTMQNVSEWKDSLVEEQPIEVKDERDGTKYTVAKLADGKVWMLDNLRLGGASAIELKPSDTNIATNWSLPASGTANFDSTNGGYTNAAINTASINTTQTQVEGSLGSGKIGVYYNYCAASAGTICSSTNSNNATYDICPKGWRMPTGGASGEYQALYIAYSSNATNFKKALSLPLSGYFNRGLASLQGSYGYFWSSTRYNGTDMYYLGVDSSSVNPQYRSSRSSGRSVRCVSSGA